MIAIEVTAPDSVEELDTAALSARTLNGRGDPVQATIRWASLDTTLLVVDSITGKTTGRQPGLGTVQARAGSLRSDPVPIRIVPAADTVFVPPGVLLRDSVSVATRDSLSDSLTVELQDTTASGPVNLSGRRVIFTLASYPAAANTVTLITSDTAHARVALDTVITAGGFAAVKVRLLASPIPDSAVVTASATRAVQTAVPGSPVRFTVRFYTP